MLNFPSVIKRLASKYRQGCVFNVYYHHIRYLILWSAKGANIFKLCESFAVFSNVW